MAKTERENLLVAEKAVPGKGTVEIPETRNIPGSKVLRRVKMRSRNRQQLPVRVCDVIIIYLTRTLLACDKNSRLALFFLERCLICGKNKKRKPTCCGKGGSWEGKCGDPGDKEYTWSEGFSTCASSGAVMEDVNAGMPALEENNTLQYQQDLQPFVSVGVITARVTLVAKGFLCLMFAFF